MFFVPGGSDVILTLPGDWYVMMTATQTPHLSSDVPVVEKMSVYLLKAQR